MSAWRDLESSCHRYFPRGLVMFLVKKRLLKQNMALRAQFSLLMLDCVG